VTLTVSAESFERIDNGIADFEADLDLEVAGNLRWPNLTGTITLVNGQVHLDHVLAMSAERRRESGGEAQSSELMPNLQAVTEERSPAANATAPGLLSNVPVAWDVRLRASDLLLEGRDLQAPGGAPIGLGNINITADGDLSLLKARSGPLLLLGEVETVRGTYEFQNRDFELLRGGTIRFTGTTDAERTISAVAARVHGGSLADPTLRLSSNPPLDQSDILSLIVFNQPTLQLGVGERVGLARRAAAIGVGFIATKLSETVSDALGLDQVDMMPASAVTNSRRCLPSANVLATCWCAFDNRRPICVPGRF
jgi:hypothetical protein